jgi:hypothetical protein
MGEYHLDNSVGMYILKKLKYLGPQYQGKRVRPGVWWFNYSLEKIMAKLEKLEKQKQGEIPWIPEEELKELFKRYYRATGDISGLINLAKAVVQWRRRVGLLVPSWVEDIYKSTTP